MGGREHTAGVVARPKRIRKARHVVCAKLRKENRGGKKKSQKICAIGFGDGSCFVFVREG